MHIVAQVSDVTYGPLVILKLMLYRCLRMSNKFLLQAGFIYLLFSLQVFPTWLVLTENQNR